MSVVLSRLTKSFGSLPVLKAIDETFEDGRISVLLGPSGCGKTTTLRCIAGLERPSGGSIELAGRPVCRDSPPLWVPAERRDISMVFQSYAIWPHMTVAQNVSLPLRAAKVAKAEVARRTAEALEMVNLGPYATRSATQLSGGQQQRVALARCIVSHSPIILMDEPLSNLDAQLRVTMRKEIRDIQRRLKRTLLFVTHDQEEALSIADTIYLFREGRIVQKGAPADVYNRPETRYAAEFLGKANIIDKLEWADEGGQRQLHIAGGARLSVAASATARHGSALCIRPEKWLIADPDRAGKLPGTIASAMFIGDRSEYQIETPAGLMTAVELNPRLRRIGDRVSLDVAADDLHFIEAV